MLVFSLTFLRITVDNENVGNLQEKLHVKSLSKCKILNTVVYGRYTLFILIKII